MRKFALLVLTICVALSTVSSAGVLREIWWQGLGIDDAIALVESGTPADQVDMLAEPTWANGGDPPANYVAKMSGWLTVPADGEYTFYVAGDDDQRLYVSQDDDPANAELIAYVDGWTPSQAWSNYETQKSAPMTLAAGQVLAMYGIMREGGGGDGQDWGWTGPGVDAIQVIPGEYLSHPYEMMAMSPSPADGATGVVDVVLSWDAPAVGDEPTYALYLGTDPEALELQAEGIIETSIDLGTASVDMELDTTYYWRVDVDGVEGMLWSFTTEPYAFAVEGVVATSDATTGSDVGGPETTADGSGLNDADEHSTDSAAMWLGVPADGELVSIQYEFPRVYKLDEMLVWNSNTGFESFLGYGFKDVTVEYSVDGESWKTLGDYEFAQAAGAENYAANTTVDFGGVGVKYVKLTANTNWGGLFADSGLSEVRFTYVPAHARLVAPADGATGVSVDTVLDWYAGRDAAEHDVYLGVDELALAATVADSSYDAELMYGMPYIWKVDEVEAAAVAFAEDFDSYAADSDLQGQNGWKGWNGDAGSSAPVSSAYAASGANAVEIIPSADLVQEFDIAGGTWVFSTMQYIPSGSTGTTYFILLNSYDDGANQDWSVQTLFNLDAGTVSSYYVEGSEAAIVFDEWVELKLVIDLDNNVVDEYYNGALLANHQWDDNEHGTIGAIDLFGNSASSVYYDDITITQAGAVWEGDLWSFSTAEFGAVAAAQDLVYDETGNEVTTVLDPAQDLGANGADTLRLSFSGNPIGFAEEDGVVTIGASGDDIWGSSDQFRYVYKSLTGDGSMTARVDSIDNIVNNWAKAGVMIRQSTAAGSQHSMTVITGDFASPGSAGNGASFQGRQVADTDSVNADAASSIAPPYYVQVVREGNNISGFLSADGVEWTQLGEAREVVMEDPVLIGLAVTSHDSGSSVIAQISEISTTGEVTGDWTVEAIGVDMPANDAADLYVAVEDAAGQIASMVYGDAAATQLISTQTWNIPVADLAALIDVTSVVSVTVGAGTPDAPAAGSGTVALSAITVGTPMSHNVAADITSADDVILGVPNDGDWPGAETPDLAIDNDVTTKYLHFKGETEPTGFQVTPAVGPTVVTELTLTTANDAVERDPVVFELYGSNDSIDGPYTLIAWDVITDFAGETEWPRFTKNETPITFENDVAYTHYQLMFTSVRDAASANSMQIAEVELIGVSTW